ncbi:HAD family hydrolase [Flavivirga spongiicola]|uniref:HAD family phosphatase n=1 Tax=Flavivirga spongiicola TaxID=421621 RepID=A0ABU7XTP8_9FLAO|nr:HAD family phosphatase [Flavivirga sp. MEBiC05379]MDO5978227.1 HAD family phosphatase [Flavivirga sp. MEBiC05379]
MSKENLSKLKNIIFDLGAVIMNLHVPKTISELKHLGIIDIVNDTGHYYTDPIFYDFEIGKVSEFEFLEKLRSMSSLNPSKNEIRDAWNAMILNIPKERIGLLINLKKKYNLYLLSNTNSIHQEKFERDFEIQNGYNFKNLFNKVYYSHQMGIRKPEEGIFRYVLKWSELEAQETLFIDDSIDNIKAAQRFGIQTFHINSRNTLHSLFRN